MPLYLVPPGDGSFKQQIIAGVVIAALGTPFVVFGERVIDSWIPSSDSVQRDKIIQLLTEQNALLRQSMGLTNTPTKEEKKQVEIADNFIREKRKTLRRCGRLHRTHSGKSFDRLTLVALRTWGLLAALVIPPELWLIERYWLSLSQTLSIKLRLLSWELLIRLIRWQKQGMFSLVTIVQVFL